ncbi:MAG: PEP-CTERM sorting domain-containing protein [Alphaproteobacteria bacterium]|nr:PEP-CTERM sorting domain-containing protein [Alphaproteobacteria bacterium]MCB9929474.1 PEP-CTERM sorting domain-containing protein [Alphaproteobacteria bacterium]
MRILTTVAVASLCLGAMPAHAFLIDDFDTGTGFNVAPSDPGPTNVPAVTAIGGSRTMAIDPASANGTTLEVTTGGTLDHGQTTAGGGSSSVTWDANGAGLGGLDLTDGGLATLVRVSVLGIDVGHVDLALEVTDTGAMTSSLALTGLNVGTFDFDFASFVGSADLTATDKIVLTIAAGTNSDVSLDLVETDQLRPPVSEPGILALAGAGLVGLAVARRRV